MREHFARLLGLYESGRIDRRQLLGALTAAFLRPVEQATQRATSLRGRVVNHVALSVADVKRSQQFYQGLFNATILNDFAEVTDLRIGDSFIGLIRTGDTGRIDHFCVGVENFDVDRLLEQLQRQYPENKPAIQVNPRGEKRLFLTDPDGIRVQLSPVKWQGRNSR